MDNFVRVLIAAVLLHEDVPDCVKDKSVLLSEICCGLGGGGSLEEGGWEGGSGGWWLE